MQSRVSNTKQDKVLGSNRLRLAVRRAGAAAANNPKGQTGISERLKPLNRVSWPMGQNRSACVWRLMKQTRPLRLLP